METTHKQIANYIKEISGKIIETYVDEEYQIELDFNGAIQIKGIRFKQNFTREQLEEILPIVFERGALMASKKITLLLRQFQSA